MKISGEKKEKISEQILSFLYSTYPQSKFTSEIAREVARDEEFVKGLMKSLKSNNLVHEVRKNPKGKEYSLRRRWKLSDNTYVSYSKIQDN